MPMQATTNLFLCTSLKCGKNIYYFRTYCVHGRSVYTEGMLPVENVGEERNAAIVMLGLMSEIM